MKSSLHIPGVLPAWIMLLFLMMLSFPSRAQSDPLFTHYWALPTFYNPATTGDTDYIRIRGGGRLQWIGIHNAPKSFTAMADTPFRLLNKRGGAGVVVMQESLGLFSNLLAAAQGSYKIPFRKGNFGIGLQVGYYNSRFKGTEIFIPDGDDYHEPDDPAIPKQDLSGNALDIGIGINYQHPLFSVSLSGAHLTAPTISLKGEGNEDTQIVNYETALKRTLYFSSSGNIKIRNSLFLMQPSIIAATDFNSFTAELTLRALYNRFISFGAGYRWKDSVAIMLGAEFKNFFLGYSYSYPLSAISKASSGSHELVAGYQLRLELTGKNKNKQRSIRLM